MWKPCKVAGCDQELHPSVAEDREDEFGIVLCYEHAEAERAEAEAERDRREQEYFEIMERREQALLALLFGSALAE